MKQKYIIFGLLASLMIGCSKDDLTISPKGKELDVTFYKNEQQIQMALNAAYDPFQHLIWGGIPYLWGSITSDDAVAGGADLSDQATYQLSDRFLLTAAGDQEDNDLLNFWESRFKIIYRSNLILKFADPGTSTGAVAIAHAYFLKGYAYFELTRMFGGMPIIDEVPNPDSKYPRASQEQTWAAIEGYLKTAIESGNLPKRSGGVDPGEGLATQASAMAALGKVYLYQKKYSDAIDILEPIAQDVANYNLETDYNKVFDPTNKHGIESIFEINFTGLDGGTIWDQYCNGNPGATLTGPRTGEVDIPDPATFQWGWGMNQPTKSLAAAFDALNDKVRKNASIISSDSVASYYPSGVTFQNELTGYWDLKHIRREGNYSSATQVNQNIILLRVADVYLMLAEAYNRTNDDANAKLFLKQVRERAVPGQTADIDAASGDALFAIIKNERRLELCLEGDRYFDLVRWGDAATVLKAEDYDASNLSYSDGLPGTASDGLFPIPVGEMQRIGNDPSFPQNKGY